MILYMVKTGDQYLRDRKKDGIELLDIEHGSVYPQKEEAQKLAEKYSLNQCILVELTVKEKDISW